MLFKQRIIFHYITCFDILQFISFITPSLTSVLGFPFCVHSLHSYLGVCLFFFFYGDRCERQPPTTTFVLVGSEYEVLPRPSPRTPSLLPLLPYISLSTFPFLPAPLPSFRLPPVIRTPSSSIISISHHFPVIYRTSLSLTLSPSLIHRLSLPLPCL